MAGQRSYDSTVFSYAREEVRASGRFTLVAANGTLTATTVFGRGVKSVVASTTTATADTYTVTFAEKFPQLISFDAVLNADVARAYTAVPGKTYTVSTTDGGGSTLVVRIQNAAGTAFTTPTAGDLVSFEAVFENQLFS